MITKALVVTRERWYSPGMISPTGVRGPGMPGRLYGDVRSDLSSYIMPTLCIDASRYCLKSITRRALNWVRSNSPSGLSSIDTPTPNARRNVSAHWLRNASSP